MTKVAQALLCVALCGCATPRETEAEITSRLARIREIEHVRDLVPDRLDALAELGAGIAKRFADTSFVAGDRLLFGIDSYAGASRTRWYLAIETITASDGSKRNVDLVQPGTDGAPGPSAAILSRFATLRVSLLDALGRRVSTAESEVAQTVHELGLFAYLRANGGARAARMRTVDSRRARLPLFLRDPDWSLAILARLYDTLTENAASTAFVTRLDVWPGVFELPGLLFASLTLHSGIDRVRVVPQPIAGLPAGDDALEFAISLWHGRPLFVVQVVVVPPLGPLAMTAGVVSATGYRPLEPERRFVMRLIGMQRTALPPG